MAKSVASTELERLTPGEQYTRQELYELFNVPETSVEETGIPATTSTKVFGSYLPQFQAQVEPGTITKILGPRTKLSFGEAKLDLIKVKRRYRASLLRKRRFYSSRVSMIVIRSPSTVRSFPAR